MIQTIIMALIKMGIGWLTEENKQKLASQVEALKGRAESVETSYAEQDKAKEGAHKAAEAAANSVGKDDTDVFGSEE